MQNSMNVYVNNNEIFISESKENNNDLNNFINECTLINNSLINKEVSFDSLTTVIGKYTIIDKNISKNSISLLCKYDSNISQIYNVYINGSISKKCTLPNYYEIVQLIIIPTSVNNKFKIIDIEILEIDKIYETLSNIDKSNLDEVKFRFIKIKTNKLILDLIGERNICNIILKQNEISILHYINNIDFKKCFEEDLLPICNFYFNNKKYNITYSNDTVNIINITSL